MSSDWTGQQRYDNTLQYLKSVDNELGKHVDETVLNGEDKGKIGEGLSLQGHKMYAVFGSKPVGRAVRALLLCQRAYLGPHWGKSRTGAGDYRKPNGPTLTKNQYLGKSEAVVQEAIRSYVATTPTTFTLADVAEDVGGGVSGLDLPWETLTRAQNPFPSGLVCFNALLWWLYKSGFVSLRWLARDGGGIGAENANELLGNGTPVTRTTLAATPRGMMVNWRGANDANSGICHWAVSLGDGYAVGANNSGGGRLNGKDVMVTFQSGGGAFGVFKMEDMWDVYSGDKTYHPKIGRSEFVVATIDPATVPNRSSGKK